MMKKFARKSKMIMVSSAVLFATAFAGVGSCDVQISPDLQSLLSEFIGAWESGAFDSPGNGHQHGPHDGMHDGMDDSSDDGDGPDDSSDDGTDNGNGNDNGGLPGE